MHSGQDAWQKTVQEVNDRRYIRVAYPHAARAAAHREERALTTLDGIVGVPTIERTFADTKYIYHEFPGIDGPSLADRFGESAVPLAVAIAELTPYARILAEAHKRSVYHGAIDLQHLGSNSRGQPVITNWQYAQIGNNPWNSKHPKFGSPNEYVAPERHTGEPASAKSDTFALAICVYRLLTGKFTYNANFEHKLVPLEACPLALAGHVPLAIAKATDSILRRRTDSPVQFIADLQGPRAETWLTRISHAIDAASKRFKTEPRSEPYVP